MMRAAALVLALAACSTEEPPTGVESDYTLAKVTAIAGEQHVAGVDADGHGGLWLAYQQRRDAWTWDDLRIVHLDAAGTKLAEHALPGPDIEVTGIAVDGDAVWINHNVGSDVSDNRVRKIDVATGTELAVIPIEGGIKDIAVRDGLLVLSSLWRELVAVDPETGTQQWRASLPALEASESRGIAPCEAGLWVVSLTEARAVLVDDSGTLLESAAFPAEETGWGVDDGLQLAIEGTTLILHRRNQIIWYARPDRP